MGAAKKDKAKKAKKPAMYRPVMERIFEERYKEGMSEVDFSRADIDRIAQDLSIDPKNLGDFLYYFRYRAKLPASVQEKAGPGRVWLIRGTGTAKYRLAAVEEEYALIKPRVGLSIIKIPDNTPGLIERYARNEEQALLARLRYNRLIDIFLGITCYSLQSHLRTQVKSVGQIEVDEIYVGVDSYGSHFSVPVQAKGDKGNRHSIVQIEQDIAFCRTVAPYTESICVPVAAQFISKDRNLIAMFSFQPNPIGPTIASEKHYRLVPHEQLTDADLALYRNETIRRRPD